MDHYPGIQYFKLKKSMPGADVGEIVNINTADGRENLWIGSIIKLHIDMAKNHPEWFEPVTDDQHKDICRESTIIYIMDHDKLDRASAIEKLDRVKIS